MNTCMCVGSVGLTVTPSEELSVGTSRQPSSISPSALIWSAMMLCDHLAPGASRFGMNSAPTAYSPGSRQLKPISARLALEEGVRDLHQDAGAVAGARIGADRAAMLEIAEDAERVGDDLMRLAALDVGDEADAAGILFQAGIVKPLGRRAPADLGPGRLGARWRARRRTVSESGPPTAASAPVVSRSNPDPFISTPLNKAKPSQSLDASPPAQLRRRPGHRSSSASRTVSRFRPGAFSDVPDERPCLWLLAPKLSVFASQSQCRLPGQLRQPCCPNFDHAKFFSITQARESRLPHVRLAGGHHASFAPRFEANAPRSGPRTAGFGARRLANRRHAIAGGLWRAAFTGELSA